MTVSALIQTDIFSSPCINCMRGNILWALVHGRKYARSAESVRTNDPRGCSLLEDSLRQKHKKVRQKRCKNPLHHAEISLKQWKITTRRCERTANGCRCSDFGKAWGLLMSLGPRVHSSPRPPNASVTDINTFQLDK